MKQVSAASHSLSYHTVSSYALLQATYHLVLIFSPLLALKPETLTAMSEAEVSIKTPKQHKRKRKILRC